MDTVQRILRWRYVTLASYPLPCLSVKKNKVINLFDGDEEDLHAQETVSCW